MGKEKKQKKIDTNIAPTISVNNKTTDLTQNIGTEVNFEAKFKIHGDIDYYYKWMTYKNGIKQTESVCTKMINNYIDKTTMIIDSELNVGKWVIYSDQNCTNQTKEYLTLTYEGKTESSSKKTLTATFSNGNANSIGSTSESCETIFLTCSVRAPSITPPSGYEVEGWSENPNGTGIIFKPGDDILINGNNTYYPILKKIASKTQKKYTVTFNKNNAQSIEKTKISCVTTTNQCSVKLPNIIAPKGYEVIGWSSKKNDDNAEYDVNQSINISSNKTLYAIIKKIDSTKEFIVTLNKNNAQSIEKTKVSCVTSNASCEVTLPSIVAKNGYEVIGWSDNPQSQNATYKVNQTITITQNKILYAITKEKPKITMTDYSKIDWKTGGYSAFLNIEVKPATDTYTVTSSNENVMVIYNDKIYTVGSGTATITATSSSGATTSFDVRVTGPDPTTNTSKLKKGVLMSFIYGNTKVYIEKGCSFSFAETLQNDVKETPAKLRDATRAIYAMTTSSYNEATGTSSVGLTYANGITNVIHINCDYKSNDVYGHELGHAVDYRYAKLSGASNFSSNPNLITLYNKYNNSGNNNLRTDKFSNSREFFADIFNYNFRTNIAKTTKKENSEYKGLTYPSDITNIIETFINEYNSLAK